MKQWFSDLKQRISLARQKASLMLNVALMELYREIGRDMVEKEEKAIVPQPVAQLPWGHNRLIVENCLEREGSLFGRTETIHCSNKEPLLILSPGKPCRPGFARYHL